MNAGWKLFLLFAAVFVVAFGAERLFVPDVVPIAFAEEPQPFWSVGTAFFLRAVELTSAVVAIVTLVVMFGMWAKSLPHRGAH